jgi:hydrogenase maturation protease
MARVSIICIGNLVRGDDGVAHHVADLVEGRLPAGASVLRAPQLDLAMADDLTDEDRLVFVDAERRTFPYVEVRPVEPEPHGEYGHSLSAGNLLEIAWALYSSRPQAWMVTVAAPDMEHTDELSRTAEAASQEAASVVLELASELVDE